MKESSFIVFLFGVAIINLTGFVYAFWFSLLFNDGRYFGMSFNNYGEFWIEFFIVNIMFVLTILSYLIWIIKRIRRKGV